MSTRVRASRWLCCLRQSLPACAVHTSRSALRGVYTLVAILAVLGACPAWAATCNVYYYDEAEGYSAPISKVTLQEVGNVGSWSNLMIGNHAYGDASYITAVNFVPATSHDFQEMAWIVGDDGEGWGPVAPATFPFYGEALFMSYLIPSSAQLDIQVVYHIPGYVPPIDPPPVTGDDDAMTDAQTAALFTNMSTQTVKIVTSNTDVVNTVVSGARLLAGLILASIFAVTWKG